MPICKNCGTENDKGSLFCEECGAKLVPEDKPSEAKLVVKETEIRLTEKKSTGVAYLLWFIGGLLGIHRFYLGHIGMGVLYIFTGGLFLIGVFIDLFRIPSMVKAKNNEIMAQEATQMSAAVPSVAAAAPARENKAEAEIQIKKQTQETVEESQLKHKKTKVGLIIGIPLGVVILVAVILLLILQPWKKPSTITGGLTVTNLSAKAQLPDKIVLNGGTATLDVLGYSKNSKYFAFGERGEGEDPIDISYQGFGNFWLVDVSKDDFVKELTSSVHYTETKSVLPSEVDELRNLFAKRVSKYGVSGNLFGEKLKMIVHERSQTYEKVELLSKSGKTYELIMSKDFNRDEFPIKGRFELSLTDKTLGKKVWLQRVGKYFKGRQGYYIHSAYIDPTNTYIVVVTLKIHYGFEGVKEPHFMVNTGRLP